MFMVCSGFSNLSRKYPTPITARMEATDPRTQLEALVERDGASYAALSRMLRRNDAYLQQFVRRGTPRDLAERDRKLLAGYFGVDETVLGGTPPASLATIRRLDLEASAGPGTLAEDDGANDSIQLDPRLLAALRLRPATTAMLRARGDSMSPTIEDGDQIVVDERDRTVGAASAIFVLRLDGGLLVKRVERIAAGYRISSDNSAYPSATAAAVEIIGRVVWLSRALR